MLGLPVRDFIGEPRDDVHDAERLTGNAAYSSTLAILEDWANAEGAIGAAAAKPGAGSKIGASNAVHLLAPILFPGTYFCAAANYKDHSEAMAKKSGRPPEPDPRTLGIKLSLKACDFFSKRLFITFCDGIRFALLKRE